jgi:hypothetical protein
MVREFLNVGETLTISFTTQAGTPSRYVLAYLTGNAVLLEEKVERAEQPGGTCVQTFTFKLLEEGIVKIRFAYYRNDNEVIFEDMREYLVGKSEAADANDSGITTLVGRKVREEGKTCIYFLIYDHKDGKKKAMAIPNCRTYLRVFNKWDFHDIPSEFFDHINKTEEMDENNARLYRCNDATSIYFCTGKLRFHIPSMDVLKAIDFNLSSATTMAKSQILELFPKDCGEIVYG